MEVREAAFSVTQINQYVARRVELDDTLQGVCVRGEISNFTHHYASGHLYFTLKDEESSIRCVMFRGFAQRLPFLPENGMKVKVYGAVRVYPRDGLVQIVAETMQKDGAGSMAEAFERLRKKLEAEGLFATERKKKLPAFPRRIGVITSPTGAAIHDIIRITGRRYPLCELILYPALVQGNGAASSLCAGVRFFNSVDLVDCIIIGRGGGSAEDLWAFNDETLARTVAASRLPVISAVGHESDVTICDFAADFRAPTPSGAAESAVPDKAELAELLREKKNRLENSAGGRLAYLRARLERFQKGVLAQPPLALLESKRERLNLREKRLTEWTVHRLERVRLELCHREERLAVGADGVLAAKRAKLSRAAAATEAMSPLAVLKRGYTLVEKTKTVKTVTSVRQLTPGDTVRLRFSDGSVGAIVTDREENGVENPNTLRCSGNCG